jgi:hypothetical protein
MADTRADATIPQDTASGRRRGAADVERRRTHPGEPRRAVTADRPSPRDDRRGAHAWAGTRSR